LSRVQDRKEGWAMLQRLSQRDMDVVSARMARAAVAASADQKEAAAAEAAAALRLAPKDSTAAIAAAQYLQDLPDGNAQAATLLKRFLDKAPEDQAARLALGRLYLADNKLKESGETLRAALKVEPENPQVLYSLAQVSYQAKEPAEAEGYLKRFIALPDTVARGKRPRLPVPLADRRGRPAQRGSDQLAGKIQGGEIFISAVSKRAQLIARDGDVDKARGLIHATTPRNQRERYALISAEALMLREAKRNQESFDLLDKAVSQDAEAADLLYDHAMAAERIDRIPVMEKSLRKLIEVRPESAHAYNALGYTLADRNQRLPEALELIKKAVALMPDDPQIIDSLGWVYYRMGDLPNALKYLRQAYASKPDVEVGAHLGEVLWTSGARDEALKVWREASGREPKNEVLRGTLARLNVSL
jgi:tetratricopeptide (TPR) repeat protein